MLGTSSTTELHILLLGETQNTGKSLQKGRTEEKLCLKRGSEYYFRLQKALIARSLFLLKSGV